MVFNNKDGYVYDDLTKNSESRIVFPIEIHQAMKMTFPDQITYGEWIGKSTIKANTIRE